MKTFRGHEWIRRALVAVAVVFWAAFVLPATASAAKILRYSDHHSAEEMRSRFLREVFFPAVERESGGRLKVEDHWNGDLVGSLGALQAAGEGRVADMVLVVPEYMGERLLWHRTFQSFPIGPATWEEQLEFYGRVHAEVPAFAEELQKQNVVSVFFSTELPVAFFSAGPLSSLEDVRGKRWRSSSPWQLAWFENAGAVPVSMPWGETPTALRNGTIDGLMVDLYRGREVKAHEAGSEMLTSKSLWWGTAYLLVMNRDTWNGLAEEDRQAIRRAADIAHKAFGPVLDRTFDVLVEDIKKGGGKIRTLSDEEVKAWRDATRYREVQAAWVAEQEVGGRKDAGTVMEKIGSILDEVMHP